MNHVMVLGNRIGYKKIGQGPLCFLIHGFGGSHGDWLRTVPLLSSSYTMVIPNLAPVFVPKPGDPPLTFSVHVHLIRNFISQIGELEGAERPFLAVGSSYGGALLWGCSILNPDLFGALVLISPMPPAPQSKFRNNTIRRFIGISQFPRLFHLYLQSPLGKMRLPLLETIFHAPWVKERKRERLAHLTQRKVRLIGHIAHSFSWTLRHEDWLYWEKRLPEIKVPVCVLWGTDDRLFADGENLRFQKSLANAELKSVENAGHLAMLEEPENVAARILEFFSDNPPVEFKTNAVGMHPR